MQPSDFSVKVADLLKETGKTDTIEFEKLFTKNIARLTEDGISGALFIESLNDDTLEATLNNLECQIQDTCDHCGKEYTRQVWCDIYETKFSSNTEQFEDEPADEIFPINENQTINTENMIVQAIGLQEPLKKLCYDCINKEQEAESQEDIDYFETSSNINITFS